MILRSRAASARSLFLSPLADSFVLAYPTKRYRSAWIGIAVHSAQSAVIVIVVLTLVV